MVCVVFDALTLYISIIDAKNVKSLLICIFFSQIDPSANRPAVAAPVGPAAGSRLKKKGKHYIDVSL